MAIRKCNREDLLKVIQTKPCLLSNYLQINAIPDNFPFTKKVLENKFEPRRHELILSYLFHEAHFQNTLHKGFLPIWDKDVLERVINREDGIIEIYTNLDFYYVIHYAKNEIGGTDADLHIICEIK